ncbi:MAG TPA: ribonuclease III [Firmicutes bacterium]|jgi:ribonuclease III family protein|nr:ribonuclease III [Bacillota bacterium]
MPSFDFLELPGLNPDELSPAVWAYIGDAVYELYIRCHILSAGPAKTNALHHVAIAMVRASFQAGLVTKLEPFLTEGELEILKRGRNVKSGHIPAHTDVLTYRHSTAFEALIGYLYLRGEHKRIKELLTQAIILGETAEHSE